MIFIRSNDYRKPFMCWNINIIACYDIARKSHVDIFGINILRPLMNQVSRQQRSRNTCLTKLCYKAH